MSRWFLVLCLPIAAIAETHTLTLRQAAERALSQNPDILIARFDEAKAQEAIREARDPFFPKVIVGSGLAYTNGFPLSIEGSAPSIVRADAIQSLYNREKSLRVSKAREQARGASIDVESKREEAVSRVANAFLDAGRLRRNAEAASQQSASLAKVFEATTARVAEGRELAVEGKRAAARVAQAKHRAAALAIESSLAEESLALLLGYPSGDRVRPAEEESFELKTPLTEEELIEAALASSKEVKSLESRLQAAGLEIRSNQAARLPKVDLVAQYGLFARFNNYDEFFRKFQRNNGQIGVSVQIPVFAGSAASAREKQAESDAARLRLEIATVRNRLRLDARRAFLDLKTGESLRDVARLDLEAAREQVSVLMAQLDEGRAGLRQVEEARFQETEKWMAYLNGQQGVERLRIAILRVSGNLIAALK